MNNYDLTDQVMAQLDYYVERMKYLHSIGDHRSAYVLETSARKMAEFADAQEEWLVVE